jgi:hypothetical protein
MSSSDTIVVTVYMAGDIETAKRWLRRRCFERGLCVTVTPTTFLYTGGEEAGFAIGFVNYPRFPVEDAATLCGIAREVARNLRDECCQKTALLVGPDVTEWLARKPPGAHEDV